VSEYPIYVACTGAPAGEYPQPAVVQMPGQIHQHVDPVPPGSPRHASSSSAGKYPARRRPAPPAARSDGRAGHVAVAVNAHRPRWCPSAAQEEPGNRMLAEVAGHVADAQPAVRIAVIRERRAGCRARIGSSCRRAHARCSAEPNAPANNPNCSASSRSDRSWAGRVVGAEGEGPPPAVDRRRKVEPAVMQGCQQGPNLRVVGVKLRRTPERCIASSGRCACRCESENCDGHRRWRSAGSLGKSGEALIPLPQVAEG